MINKPNKTIYKNQKQIRKKIIKKIRDKFLDKVKEAYLIGSLAEGKFGIYDKEFEGYFGSDIDIVAIPAEITIKWKYEGDFYDWHSLYNIGEIKIKDTLHPIMFMIPFEQDINLFWKKAKELNWKIEKLK